MATILIAIDSSGSISNEELGAFMTELWAAHQTRLVDLWALICDASITDVIHPIRKITLITGRGGTDFRPVFKWALNEALHPPLDGIIYLTDGYGPAPSERPRIPTLWCITHDGVYPTSKGSSNDDDEKKTGWGQLLRLPEFFEKEKKPIW
jgi:predicted metal-dependent peptidase